MDLFPSLPLRPPHYFLSLLIMVEARRGSKREKNPFCGTSLQGMTWDGQRSQQGPAANLRYTVFFSRLCRWITALVPMGNCSVKSSDVNVNGAVVNTVDFGGRNPITLKSCGSAIITTPISVLISNNPSSGRTFVILPSVCAATSLLQRPANGHNVLTLSPNTLVAGRGGGRSSCWLDPSVCSEHPSVSVTLSCCQVTLLLIRDDSLLILHLLLKLRLKQLPFREIPEVGLIAQKISATLQVCVPFPSTGLSHKGHIGVGSFCFIVKREEWKQREGRWGGRGEGEPNPRVFFKK